MQATQLFFEEYFMARRWFFHHILVGLLIGLVAGAAVMWFATDRYFDSEASATISGGDFISPGEDFVSQPVDTVHSAATLQKTVELKAAPVSPKVQVQGKTQLRSR